ncbi:hypothetical protein [Vagococcus intermedius]|uniref:Uncharacterized protein n=1 Tax=Vagococcus intermedius TaxID=2991418 RepID=A0AAF0CU12_9ENTE|nr:hypothetical protein [Vagococcus intermedius]WEG72999.1 hypothetical protein OL234_08470 [Vagococcus intermedius]WEG75085.1 hypothetical protein OL235_08465 [Vagococcus intermedius]
MFKQKKIYKTLENRNFTPDSLLSELEEMKKYDFDNVSYTGLNLNLDMLMTQHIRDEKFQLIEVQNGLAKKPYTTWQNDLTLAINVFNHFIDYTKEHFNTYLAEAKIYQEETGHSQSSSEFKNYFEQGNGMYFHDVLHSVFDISRRLDLSIEDFEESLTSDGEDLNNYPLPEKRAFEGKR